MRSPAIFVGHGSPMNAIERNRYTEAWSALAAELPTPRAILAISAHWYVEGLAVLAGERPRTIHDFYGFPRGLYDVEYPAAGDPALAERVAALLAPEPVLLDRSAWGFDHGIWSVLVHVFPRADVPLISLCVDARRDARAHWELARRLAPLRDEGVLIVGSGNIVHNLRLLDFGDPGGYPWAQRFDAEIARALESGDSGPLVDYARHPDAALAVPTPDHYLPMLYPAALRAPDERFTWIVEGLEFGSLSMRSFRIG
jgi:4,5-DOPA dioxygenase extradiol